MTPNVTKDLADRWRLARLAALRSVVKCTDTPREEAPLIALALARDADSTLRAVYDNSRKLGLGFRSYYAVDLPLRDIAAQLPQLGTPCHIVAWEPVDEPPHYRSERAGCRVGALHPGACAYFREATDGLVMGLSSSVHFARYESLGSGGRRCVDALFVQPTSALRFGVTPDELKAPLEQVLRTARALDSSARLEFLGVAEGVLYYTLEVATIPGRVHPGSAIRQALRRRCPSLELRDVTPRSIALA